MQLYAISTIFHYQKPNKNKNLLAKNFAMIYFRRSKEDYNDALNIIRSCDGDGYQKTTICWQ